MKFLDSSNFIKGLIVGGTLAVGLSILTSHAQEAPPPSVSTGPYLLMQGANSRMYCINSQTGQVWRKMDSATHWEKDGNPPKESP
jgi:hypothetical protein